MMDLLLDLVTYPRVKFLGVARTVFTETIHHTHHFRYYRELRAGKVGPTAQVRLVIIPAVAASRTRPLAITT